MMTKHSAISVLYSVRVTLTNHYWVTSDERRRCKGFLSVIEACSRQLTLRDLANVQSF
jgi:hypothetical protein